MTRERLATRLGFIFLSAGCAIGLGNVWRFPYVVGQNGGGWFVILYLAFLALLAIPVLVMEFATGRAAQRSIAGLHAAVTPDKPIWRWHGVAGSLGNLILMMFYTTVTAWMVVYFGKSVMGTANAEYFPTMLNSPGVVSATMIGVSLGAAGVCALGLQKGVESVSKFLMAGLLLLIVVLAAHSLMLEGASEGVEFYLVPDFARMRSAGVGKVVVEAMNQAFFTLSLGIGAMAIFGSYIRRERTLLGEALNVAFLDTFVALVSGLIIMPACFAFNVEPGAGPGLIFVTLPKVFASMPFGRLWSSLFFLFMSFAALTTVLAVFETILACLCDYTGWSRRRGCVVLAIAVPILSLPCVLGFNLLEHIQPLGEDSCILDLEDFIVSNLLLPLGAIAFMLYTGHRFGWGWKGALAEANAGVGPKIPDSRILRLYCAYVLPTIVFVVFAIGLYNKFA